MPRFKAYNYDQNAMVVINYQNQLQPGTFEHAVHYLIEHKLDLSVFHPKYRNDATGRLGTAQRNTDAYRTQVRPTIAMA
ncbi:transposase [Halomonas sp. SpR1]|uniref:transposase n=1 Tax=Halomonas sp. SpR1 TaxID=3050462 RepID=UPI0027E4D819|nr:transposase [Halomonas sp. SpR1]MDQ7733111.1 transposase [Halomonas sp. SpR1]